MAGPAASPGRDRLAALPRALIDDIRAWRTRGSPDGARVRPFPDLRFQLEQCGWHFTIDELRRICSNAQGSGAE